MISVTEIFQDDNFVEKDGTGIARLKNTWCQPVLSVVANKHSEILEAEGLEFDDEVQGHIHPSRILNQSIH